MNCAEAEALIGASLDGELDALTALRVDRHVSECQGCAARLADLTHLREEIAAANLDWSARADLQRLERSIRKKTGTSSSWWQNVWIWRPMLVSAAAVLLLAVFLQGVPGGGAERQVLDSHLRSLMADHLVDVTSSDRHTVKPSFQGKLNFAPSVPDLAGEGFKLIGGRLDVLNGKRAAALVYKRREHTINVWIQPADGGAGELKPGGAKAETIDGYQMLRWRNGEMRYWAVSDLNAAELRELSELLRTR